VKIAVERILSEVEGSSYEEFKRNIKRMGVKVSHWILKRTFKKRKKLKREIISNSSMSLEELLSEFEFKKVGNNYYFLEGERGIAIYETVDGRRGVFYVGDFSDDVVEKFNGIGEVKKGRLLENVELYACGIKKWEELREEMNPLEAFVELVDEFGMIEGNVQEVLVNLGVKDVRYFSSLYKVYKEFPKIKERYEELKKEVRDLETIQEIYAGALLAQQGEAVKIGVTVWNRKDLERELEKVRVILRGKMKALNDWKVRVERLRREVEQGEAFLERLYNARIKICGEVVEINGENKA